MPAYNEFPKPPKFGSQETGQGPNTVSDWVSLYRWFTHLWTRVNNSVDAQQASIIASPSPFHRQEPSPSGVPIPPLSTVGVAIQQANEVAYAALMQVKAYPRAPIPATVEDTKANFTSTNYGPDAYPLGTVFHVTDWNVFYVCRIVAALPTWVCLPDVGYYSSTLANKPTTSAYGGGAIGVNDAGLEFYATDYARRWRWTGAAWQRAPGEDAGDGATRMFADFTADPGTGWAFCDGSNATATNNDATTTTVTTPDFRGYYPKPNTLYTRTQVAAGVPSGTVASTFTGSALASHAHNIPLSLDTGTPSLYVTDTYGTGTPTVTAKEKILGLADSTAGLSPLASSAVSAGTPAGTVTSTFTGTVAGEPAHMDVLRYMRL